MRNVEIEPPVASPYRSAQRLGDHPETIPLTGMLAGSSPANLVSYHDHVSPCRLYESAAPQDSKPPMVEGEGGQSKRTNPFTPPRPLSRQQLVYYPWLCTGQVPPSRLKMPFNIRRLDRLH